MSNQQLYLAIGIPALIAIFNTGLLVSLMLHFMNKLDGRIDKLDSRMDGRIDKLDSRFDRLETKVDTGFARIEGELKSLRKDYTEFYAEQRRHDEAIDTLKKQVKS